MTSSPNSRRPRRIVRGVAAAVALVVLVGGGVAQGRGAPKPPGTLTATVDGVGVALSWVPSEDGHVTGYRVYRRTGSSDYAPLADVEIAQLLDPVLPGTTFSYRVTAYDETGQESAPSNEVSAAAPGAAAGAAPPAGPVDRHVRVGGYAFSPAGIVVNRGDTVVWDWSAADTDHSVTARAGQAEAFESHPGVPAGNINGAPAGGSFRHTFLTLGRISYVCRVHSDMTATVTVVAGDAPAVQDQAALVDAPATARTGDAAPASAPRRGARQHFVKVADYAFSPARLDVEEGDVVTWRWTGSDRNHSVTSAPAAPEDFDSHAGLTTAQITGPPASGSFSRSFARRGTFPYLCRLHPGMTGTVTVGPPRPRIALLGVRRAGRGLLMRYRTSEAGTVRAALMRGDRRLRTYRLAAQPGTQSRRLAVGPAARRGALRVVAQLVNGEGRRSARVAARVRRATGR